MPFGLTNALVTFMNMMNNVLSIFLDKFVLVFIVDVYVTSECIHLCILCIVTQCLFWFVSIMYLSHVVMP